MIKVCISLCGKMIHQQKVQIDYSLHNVYWCTCTTHSKLPVDRCTMYSLSSSTVHSVKLSKTGGQRWRYTCVNYMAVIAVWSPLESLLAFEHLIRA